MPCSFVVYVDEAGDEGFSFSSGSSEWFVLSAVLTLKAEDLETVKLVDRVRQRLKRPDRKPLHFRDLRHEHRLPFIDEVARASLRAVTLLIHKPSLQELELLRQPNQLYFHGAQKLIEGVCRLCQSARPRYGDGTAEVVFSIRSGMSYEDLKRSINADQFRGTPIRLDQIYAYSSGQRMGLQIADAVASGFFKAVEPSQYGHTEDRYARMLKSVLYRKEDTYEGYGLEFWPWEPKKRFAWFREVFEEEG